MDAGSAISSPTALDRSSLSSRVARPYLLQPWLGQTASTRLCPKSLLPQVKPIFSGFLDVNGVVQTSQLRLREGYELPATVMRKAGAFLQVPQNVDESELFVGHQGRFEQQDAVGWEVLRQDKQKLYDMLQEIKADWPDVAQSALEAPPVGSIGFWARFPMDASIAILPVRV